MSKKLLKCFFISLLLIISCAPKPRVALPPTLYSGEDLSLEEIISKVSLDTNVIKLIAEINIYKNSKPFDSVNASVLVRKPGQVHMRIYKFGILARDFIIKDNELHMLSGKNSSDLKRLGTEFYNSVFWWEMMKTGVMQRERKTYKIKTPNSEIHIDRATLLPLKQKITDLNSTIDILYSEPRESEDGSWHPSVINIQLNNFEFVVKLKKLIQNPSLSDSDFNAPR